ncbi:hypothetical protein [Paenibacillus dendritiformis]|uniref:hypothetical protein n=1 Tax=Paenibacillus dendritiformis TaxID=130049 RepID=UPI003D120FB1
MGRQAGWYLVFVLPLAAALLLPVSSLGSAMAEKKGVQYSIAQERTRGPERDRMPGTEGRSSGTRADGTSASELPLVWWIRLARCGMKRVSRTLWNKQPSRRKRSFGMADSLMTVTR